MIRVLHTGMTSNLGGIESYLINYYRKIDKSKIQFDFVNIEDDLCFSDEIKRNGGIIYNLVSYYKNPIKYIRSLKKIIEDNDYKIVHCNMNSAVMIFPLIAAKLAKAKVIIAHSHNSSSDKGRLKTVLHNINRYFIPFLANYYFACSVDAGKWFFSKKIIASKRFKVINNAIDTNKFRYDDSIREKIRCELNIDSDTKVLGHVGRFSKQKNHNFLIDIFYEYNKKNNNSLLLLLGKGTLVKEVEDKVKNYGLEDKVLFVGTKDNVYDYMFAMDYFIFPSLYEGLGIVLVEAQATGLPVLTTDVIPDEAIVSDKFYKLSLKNTAREWAYKIDDLEVTNRHQNSLCLDYDIERNTKLLEDFYGDVYYE